jgi:uncharacterized protein YqgC (DUF456 family)
MEIALIILAFLAIIVGIGGSVLPVIPGPPIAFVGILFMHFSSPQHHYSLLGLLAFGGLAVLVTALDFLVPAWGTKKFGGTKWGVRGANIGLFLAAIVLPFLGVALPVFGLSGIVLGPFIGAVVAELLAGMKSREALRAGFGSFVGFLAGTMAKLAYGFAALVSCVVKLGMFS